jgi:hypothetical protein
MSFDLAVWHGETALSVKDAAIPIPALVMPRQQFGGSRMPLRIRKGAE